jgi:hypothetical protein
MEHLKQADLWDRRFVGRFLNSDQLGNKISLMGHLGNHQSQDNGDHFDRASFATDLRRMTDIASRVPEDLRRAGWRGDSRKIVGDFSELVKRYGIERAEELVWPVEFAINHHGWRAVREYDVIKGRTVIGVVARRPDNSYSATDNTKDVRDGR